MDNLENEEKYKKELEENRLKSEALWNNLKDQIKGDNEENERTLIVDPAKVDSLSYAHYKKRYNDIEEKTKDIISKKLELSEKFEEFNNKLGKKLRRHIEKIEECDIDDIAGRIKKIDSILDGLQKKLEHDKITEEQKLVFKNEIEGLEELKELYLDARTLNRLNELIFNERDEYIKDFSNLENKYSKKKRDFSKFEDIRMKDINEQNLEKQASEYDIKINDTDPSDDLGKAKEKGKDGSSSSKKDENNNKKDKQGETKGNSLGGNSSNLPIVIDPNLQNKELIQKFLELPPDSKSIFLGDINNYLRIYNAVDNISQSNFRFLLFGSNMVLKRQQRNELRLNMNKYVASSIINIDNDKENVLNIFSKLSGLDSANLNRLYLSLYKEYNPKKENPYIMNGKMSKENNEIVKNMINSFNEKLEAGQISQDEKAIFENYIMKPVIASSINKSLRHMGTLSNIKQKVKGMSSKVEKTEKLIPEYIKALSSSASNMNADLRSKVEPENNPQTELPTPTKSPLIKTQETR